MRIHAYLLCFNEEEIIGRTLDYYSGFCSRIFVFDNLSTDRSREIARSYPCTTVIDFDTDKTQDEPRQVQIKSQAYRDYSRDGGKYTSEVADWVISCDMDEILYHPNLVDVLRKYKELGITVPHTTGFNMVGENEISDSLPLVDQYPQGVRAPGYDKRIVFDPGFDMSYTKGSHPWGPGFDLMKVTCGYKSSNAFPLALLHYKHVGSRLYRASVRNLARHDASKIVRNAHGGYAGPGGHYKTIVEAGPGYAPFADNARPVFDERGHIRFSAFAPASGERGVNQRKPLSQEDVEELLQIAEAIRDVDSRAARSLVELVVRHRPGQRHRLDDFK